MRHHTVKMNSLERSFIILVDNFLPSLKIKMKKRKERHVLKRNIRVFGISVYIDEILLIFFIINIYKIFPSIIFSRILKKIN